MDRARALREDGKIDDAIAAYQRSVDLDAAQVDAWLELILLLTEISQHQMALETSELAVQKLPNGPKILARIPNMGSFMGMHNAGDMDGDADIDIVLGSMIEGPGAVPVVLTERWRDLQRPFLYLENQQK